MLAPDAMLSGSRRLLEQTLRARAVWCWGAVVLLLHAAVWFSGGPEAVRFWFERLGLSREGFLAGGIWQIASYGFLHGAWWHVGVNVLFVLLLGSKIEHIAGPAEVSRILAGGILAGGIAHLLLGTGLLVGLSGGCLALLLYLTTLSPQSRMFPLPVSGRSLGFGIVIAESLLALVNPELGIPGFQRIGAWMSAHGMGAWFLLGHACHLGGGLAGIAFARWVLRPRVSLERLRRDRARREAERVRVDQP